MSFENADITQMGPSDGSNDSKFPLVKFTKMGNLRGRNYTSPTVNSTKNLFSQHNQHEINQEDQNQFYQNRRQSIDKENIGKIPSQSHDNQFLTSPPEMVWNPISDIHSNGYYGTDIFNSLNNSPEDSNK